MATATVAATDLRAELKEWERAFADANGGRKAGRQDIKSNPDIGTIPEKNHWFKMQLANITSRQIQNLRPLEGSRDGKEQEESQRPTRNYLFRRTT